MIAGFETPTAGEIIIDGQDMARAAQQAAGQHGVPVLCGLPAHDGARQCRLRLKVAGVPREETRPRVEEALDMVQARPASRPQARPDVGRPAPARGAGPRPGQAAQGAAARRAALGARCQAARGDAARADPAAAEVGITFIIVTHDQDEALSMADRIAVMDKGRVQQIAPPARTLRASGQPLRRRLHRHDEPAARPGAGHCRRSAADRSRGAGRDRAAGVRGRLGRGPARHPAREGAARAPATGRRGRSRHAASSTRLPISAM